MDSPLDTWVGGALLVVAAVVALFILGKAWRDAYLERRESLESERAGQEAIDTANLLVPGVAPGLPCGSINCQGVGEFFVRDRWVCRKCMEYLTRSDPNDFPFDQEAVEAVDQAERWANDEDRHGHRGGETA